ncbi:hypothetical protein LCGC14_2746040, partial [marine sediment metagenome]
IYTIFYRGTQMKHKFKNRRKPVDPNEPVLYRKMQCEGYKLCAATDDYEYEEDEA